MFHAGRSCMGGESKADSDGSVALQAERGNGRRRPLARRGLLLHEPRRSVSQEFPVEPTGQQELPQFCCLLAVTGQQLLEASAEDFDRELLLVDLDVSSIHLAVLRDPLFLRVALRVARSRVLGEFSFESHLRSLAAPELLIGGKENTLVGMVGGSRSGCGFAYEIARREARYLFAATEVLVAEGFSPSARWVENLVSSAHFARLCTRLSDDKATNQRVVDSSYTPQVLGTAERVLRTSNSAVRRVSREFAEGTQGGWFGIRGSDSELLEVGRLGSILALALSSSIEVICRTSQLMFR
jgi:hypothetical protein